MTKTGNQSKDSRTVKTEISQNEWSHFQINTILPIPDLAKKKHGENYNMQFVLALLCHRRNHVKPERWKMLLARIDIREIFDRNLPIIEGKK